MSWDFETDADVTLDREVLRGYKASDGLFPTMHPPKLRAQAREKYDDLLYASTTGAR